MNFDEYEEAAASTAVYPGAGEFTGLAYAALGLTGEAGEVAEKVKKLWRDNGQLTAETRVAIGKELGDVLWYIAAVAREVGVDLDDVAQRNVVKLKSRMLQDKLGGSGDDREVAACPAPGGCDGCPDPDHCRDVRIRVGITTAEQEAAA